jgi:hypothetical protein
LYDVDVLCFLFIILIEMNVTIFDITPYIFIEKKKAYYILKN